jgi:hypothetical protein
MAPKPGKSKRYATGANDNDVPLPSKTGPVILHPELPLQDHQLQPPAMADQGAQPFAKTGSMPLPKKPRISTAAMVSTSSSSSSRPVPPHPDPSVSAPAALAPVAPPEAAGPSRLGGLLKQKFLTNSLSGKDIGDFAAAATVDGARGVERLAQVQSHPSNAARDVMRACLKGCTFPSLYYAAVRVRDPSTQEVRRAMIPFLLPHETIPAILAQQDEQQKRKWREHPTRQMEVDQWCATYQQASEHTYPIGLHGDGVPFKAKMQDSIEEYSWSFICDPSSPRNLFCALPKSWVCGRDTHEDVLRVFSESMQALATGQYPTSRLDKQLWQRPSDNARAKLVGPLGCSACLLELRGDWAFYSQVLGFPNWAAHRICWRCVASKEGATSYLDTGPTAQWRLGRLTGEQFLAQQRQQGIPPSVIFSSPGCTVESVKIDWLHCMDLGVSQTIMGNVLWELQELQQGATAVERVAVLWKRLKEYYRRVGPPAQFQNLSVEMLRQPGKSPKLRGKAAETRFAVGFVAELALEYQGHSPHQKLVSEVMQHLQVLYTHIDMTPYPAMEVCTHCRALCIKFVALQQEALHHGHAKLWKLKPKFHMMQELLEYECVRTGQSPRLFWTYADESWGGQVAKMATRRGGAKSPEAIGEAVMSRYRAWVNEG